MPRASRQSAHPEAVDRLRRMDTLTWVSGFERAAPSDDE
jgi:hypothetical protein